MSRKLSFPVFDADNHMYETPEAFTRHLPPEAEGLIKYVQVNGRTKIAIKNTISEYIPNPTFSKVAPPGAQEIEFRLKNPSSKTKPGDIEVAPPPRYIEAPPAFFAPEPRLALMDELSIDRAVMWPTLASLLEERLSDDPRGDAHDHPRPQPVDARGVDLQLRRTHLRHARHRHEHRGRGHP